MYSSDHFTSVQVEICFHCSLKDREQVLTGEDHYKDQFGRTKGTDEAMYYVSCALFLFPVIHMQAQEGRCILIKAHGSSGMCMCLSISTRDG